MPRVEFPKGLKGGENLPRTRQSLTNCFNTLDGKVLSRPGITELNTTSKVARGQFVWEGSLYQVVSQSLIKITNVTTGAFSTIGTIAGSNDVVVAIGFNTATIIVKGGNLYTLDSSDTLVDITGNANIVSCAAVAHIDGRFVYIPADGDPAFFSDVGAAGTVQATSFFDAEQLPDKNSTVFNFNGTLYIGGTDSFELFRNTGVSPVPFIRIVGAAIENGFIGGLIEYNTTFLFIGREKDQGFGIYAIGQGLAPKISNETIDLILTGYSQDELAIAVGSRFKWRGYDIAVITLKRDSFAFFGGEWFFVSTLSDGVENIWGAGFINQLDGRYYTAYLDKIGVLEKVNTDYGEMIPRVIDIGFLQEDNRHFAAQSLSLGISQGFNPALSVDQEIFDGGSASFRPTNLADGGTASSRPVNLADGGKSSRNEEPTSRTVALFTSKDNILYRDPLFRELGDVGEYDKKLEWNYAGGLGMYDGFMGLRIYTTQNLEFQTDGMWLNTR